MFVKNGLYTGGIFKFVVEFPTLYPIERPTAKFSSKMWHPLVDSFTGEINLDCDLKDWVPGKHWAITVLMLIKKMLLLV